MKWGSSSYIDLHERHQPLGSPTHVAGSTEASADVISLIQHMVILLETSSSSVSTPIQVF